MNLTHLRTMLEMQCQLNAVVDPVWIASEYPWHRAIMVEAVEALDHHGWKWWKATGEPDVAQIQLELVDIWHFAMSLILTLKGGDIEASMDTMGPYFIALDENPDVYGEISSVKTETLFDLLAGSAGSQRQLNGPAFNALMKRFSLSWGDMYRMYLAKNVLNMFRQANGYKTGVYVKEWHGKEDNVVLTELMVANPGATPDELTALLDKEYQTLPL
jgi:dimeric dUTPase (all-alpha-NTP-PPase superfamily)